MGNMGEPENADEYVLRYGRNPFTHEPETIESFNEKYTIDPQTGDPVPKDNPLRDLKKEKDDESFDTIVRENEFTERKSFIEKYVSEEGLEIHYLKKK